MIYCKKNNCCAIELCTTVGLSCASTRKKYVMYSACDLPPNPSFNCCVDYLLSGDGGKVFSTASRAERKARDDQAVRPRAVTPPPRRQRRGTTHNSRRPVGLRNETLNETVTLSFFSNSSRVIKGAKGLRVYEIILLPLLRVCGASVELGARI